MVVKIKVFVPTYFDKFRCIADKCPDTCCIGWEVEVDDDTAGNYAQIPGTLGDELRAHLTKDAEGALCFPLDGARCPFLDGEGLCRIHRELGQEYTSLTCREHPRFTEDFGTLLETSLSASCPEAARLLLADHAPLSFAEETLPDTDEEEDAWLAPLLELRHFAMSLLADSGLPIRHRMAQVLMLAVQAQALLDEDRADALPSLCTAPPELPQLPADIPCWMPPLCKAVF